VEKLIFSKAEQMIYDSVYLDAKRKFQQLDDQGLVNKNYTNILAMLMKLRRAVLHPTLVQGADLEEGDDAGTSKAESVIKQSQDDMDRNKTFAQGVQDNLASISETECPICLDVSENPVLVPGCMHQGYVLSMRYRDHAHASLQLQGLHRLLPGNMCRQGRGRTLSYLFEESYSGEIIQLLL
jgi:hypothetical protein